MLRRLRLGWVRMICYWADTAVKLKLLLQLEIVLENGEYNVPVSEALESPALVIGRIIRRWKG